MAEEKLNIAMFGHKHVLSREGGIEIVVNELSTRMVQRGHRVVCYDRKTRHVAGCNLDERQEYKGVKIVPVWTIERKGFAAMTSSISAAWKAARSKADVVHIHAEGPAVMCWLPKLRGKKVVVTIHGLDWQRAKWGRFSSKYIKFGEKQAVRWADEIIVLSREMKEYFSKVYNRDTVFIPNGVSKPKIREAEEITKLWGLKKDGYILFLGRLVPEKGLRYLIEAWKNIKSDKKLVIAGGSSDTEGFLQELQDLCSDYKESIIFTGFQEGKVLEELYSNAYVYTLPSDLEGMPLGLLEAMSYGNCCLVSDIPECTEVVEDKAMVFEHSSIPDLTEKLQILLKEQETVKHYKVRAAKYILERYNWEDVVSKTIELYK